MSLLLFMLGSFTYSQVATDCLCPKKSDLGIFDEAAKPDSIFNFSNNQKILLCGYKEKQDAGAVFSEFILQVCGQDSIIDFWDATQTCRITQQHDSLEVTDLRLLPTGKDRAFITTGWSTEKFYFSKGNLKRVLTINPNIRKYSKAEIRKTLSEFKSLKKDDDAQKILDLGWRLLIAKISGSDPAAGCLDKFETKFGPFDGAVAEDFNDLKAMLAFIPDPF